jgi:hypothetical protein
LEAYHGRFEQGIRIWSFREDLVDVEKRILGGLGALREVVYFRLVG